jgi:iron complex transport system substrate-binding protein
MPATAAASPFIWRARRDWYRARVRIVSLLPSATEILFAVGAGDQVVGVTFECDFPPEARTRTIVSNTALPQGLSPFEIDAEVRARMAAGEDLYTLDEGALRSLDPDLVVTQDLCAVCAVDITEVDKALEHLGCRAEVITLDPMTLDEVLTSIETVGRATNVLTQASSLVHSLRGRLERVSTAVAGLKLPRVAVLEWTDPPFSSGHWVPDMVTAAGGQSVLGVAGERSKQVAWADIALTTPDVIVVAPCGYRLDGAVELAEVVVNTGLLPPGVPVWAVDADAAFVRPGPRVIDGVEALAHIAHPEVMEAPSDMLKLVSRAN